MIRTSSLYPVIFSVIALSTAIIPFSLLHAEPITSRRNTLPSTLPAELPQQIQTPLLPRKSASNTPNASLEQGVQFPTEEIKKGVAHLLRQKGGELAILPNQLLEIRLHGMGPNISLTNMKLPIRMRIESMQVDPRKRQFQTHVTFQDPQQQTQQRTVIGQYQAVELIPVLIQNKQKGEIIMSEDLTMKPVPHSMIRDQTIQQREQLIGKQARRALTRQLPLRQNDVNAAYVVQKQRPVQMLFQNNALRITDMGIALEDGHEGQMIRVKNTRSHNVVHAEVIGPNQVRIGTNMQSNATQKQSFYTHPSSETAINKQGHEPAPIFGEPENSSTAQIEPNGLKQPDSHSTLPLQNTSESPQEAHQLITKPRYF
jgi:flagella basal body P-ring formation protein FlgA